MPRIKDLTIALKMGSPCKRARHCDQLEQVACQQCQAALIQWRRFVMSLRQAAPHGDFLLGPYGKLIEEATHGHTGSASVARAEPAGFVSLSGLPSRFRVVSARSVVGRLSRRPASSISPR